MPAMDAKAYLALLQEKEAQIKRDMEFCGDLMTVILSVACSATDCKPR
jgi:hypothetical protein